MVGEGLAKRGDARPPARLPRRRDHREIEAAAGGADLLEPGGAGEIVGAGHGRRRRRHQPRPQPHGGAGGEAGHRRIVGDVDPHATRQSGIVRQDDEADRLARRQALERLDLAGEGGEPLAREHRRGQALRLPPDVAAADDGGEAEDRRRPPPARAGRQRQWREHRGGGEEQEGGPGVFAGKCEPGRGAEAEADGKPQRELVALDVGEPFEPRGRPVQPRPDRAGQAPW
jgi:hypothetical protein